jgi:hypothetical protein
MTMNDAAEQPAAALPPVEDRPNAVIDMTVESDEPNALDAAFFEDEPEALFEGAKDRPSLRFCKDSSPSVVRKGNARRRITGCESVCLSQEL